MTNSKNTKVNKRETYPTKMLMNLYYKEDKTTRVSTILLYVMFGVVLLIGVIKFAIADPLAALREQEELLAAKERQLAQLMSEYADYRERETEEKYNRHAQNYLNEDEQEYDRIGIMNMLEETVFLEATVEAVSILEDLVYVQFYGLNLEEVAALVDRIEAYGFVENVEVQSSSKSEDEDETSSRVTAMLIDVTKRQTGGDEK